ncbi:MAG: Rieske 2Fe-2S domain-containing protein [Pseudomonadales bacterium]|nr:Rieske 2Fe-2S domain-containing protein [Pseudomonadales bacterium]
MHRLCDEDAVPEGESRGFSLPGAKAEAAIFAVKKRGKLFVYYNSCPHTGVGLEWVPDRFLNYEKDLIQCSLHGALFEIDTGYCIHGPCARQSLRSMEHVIKNGTILVKLPD